MGVLGEVTEYRPGGRGKRRASCWLESGEPALATCGMVESLYYVHQKLT